MEEGCYTYFFMLRKQFIFLSVIIQYLDNLFKIDFSNLALKEAMHYGNILNLTFDRFMSR